MLVTKINLVKWLEGKLEVSYRWFRTCKDAEDWCMREGCRATRSNPDDDFTSLSLIEKAGCEDLGLPHDQTLP